MKKLITGFLIALMVIIPFSSAFATDNATGVTPTKKQQAVEKKAQRDAIKQALAQKKADLKAQHDRNQALRDQIKAKHMSIKETLKALRKANDDAAKAKIAKVKTELQNLTTSKEALKGMRDAGKPYWAALKVNVKALNLDGAITNLNSIATLRDSRFEQLTKINTVLGSVITILAQN